MPRGMTHQRRNRKRLPLLVVVRRNHHRLTTLIGTRRVAAVATMLCRQPEHGPDQLRGGTEVVAHSMHEQPAPATVQAPVSRQLL